MTSSCWTRLAEMPHRFIEVTPAQAAAGKSPSAWVVMAGGADSLGDVPFLPGWKALHANPQSPIWTDDFSDVLSVTRFS